MDEGTFGFLTPFMQCHIPSKQFDEDASRQPSHCSREGDEKLTPCLEEDA